MAKVISGHSMKVAILMVNHLLAVAGVTSPSGGAYMDWIDNETLGSCGVKTHL